MPEVFLTEAQRAAKHYGRIRECIGTRFNSAMHKLHLSQDGTAEYMGMNRATVKKILDGEDVQMSTTKFLQILDFAGLKLVDRAEDQISKEGKK